MVVSDQFHFYNDADTRPVSSDSRRHMTTHSYTSSTDMKKEVVVSEIPLFDMPTEKPLAKAPSEPLRRSQELARPKRKPKPKPFDRLVKAAGDQSLFVKGVIIAILSAVPFVVFLCVAKFCFPEVQRVANLPITLVQLATWLIVCWGSFVGILYLGRVVALGVSWICKQSTSLNRFRSLARETCLRITMLLWAAVGYAVAPQIFTSQDIAEALTEKDKTSISDWNNKMRLAFMFLMIAFAIILVQGILLQLISIQYIEGFIGPRAEKASDELLVLKDLNHLVRRHLSSDDIGIVSRFLKSLLLPIDSKDLYYVISRGEGDEDIWNEYAGNIWTTISNGRSFLTAQDLSRQLTDMNRDPERGRDLFLQLDDSLDGQITEDEVTKLVHKIGLQLNRRTQAMSGIRHLMQKLEIVLSILMLGLILCIYVIFFSNKDMRSNIGSLWSGIVGLSFAFSGAVTEFVNSSVFCFGKHPYDIGDYVDVKGKKYVVARIFLTHTNFEQVQNEHIRGLVTQMSHASLIAEPIVNWTRTLEEASGRHARAEGESGAVAGERDDAVARLVVAKLEHLKKTKEE
ncbi:hypothetical protein LTR70_005853 [Exophiala xenobiotica]|uniref:EF-hand domain-containing protein n=1 Tax=Lithohypha guttulata TaxID=1690604 RepID=A0ABR0KAK1_9EURO|nr:hypothetical protein LTR24_005449 [Lithohypha guttulata]KAK5317353.1 hypothetical protein LTR70_005853 [Exophiala xenobiotica]